MDIFPTIRILDSCRAKIPLEEKSDLSLNFLAAETSLAFEASENLIASNITEMTIFASCNVNRMHSCNPIFRC